VELQAINVEEKLSQNRYRVDTGRPHIRVIDPAVCGRCDPKPCVVCCPAGCWRIEEDGAIDLVVDGCLECGTCRIVCEPKNVDWNYPCGGFGILFKFG
jgi:ferredoxin like protein